MLLKQSSIGDSMGRIFKSHISGGFKVELIEHSNEFGEVVCFEVETHDKGGKKGVPLVTAAFDSFSDALAYFEHAVELPDLPLVPVM